MDRPNVGRATIVRGNALELALADESVDLVVTSPPYFGLRSYQDGGEHYEGQIGDEATPAEFVDALVAATAEMVRVLKPSGSIWVNLGDKYAGGGMGPQGSTGDLMADRGYGDRSRQPTTAERRAAMGTARAKSLIGIPWRYALRCIDDLGLILRAEVIWSKPNGLPESVTDRVRRSHEQWFHFTKEPRYFSAVDEIREPQASLDRKQGGPNGRTSFENLGDGRVRNVSLDTLALNPLGKLPGSVWTVPTQPLKVPESLGVDHFAAFPMEWPRRIIQGWSPSGVCVECGEGRRPVTRSLRAPNVAKGIARREASNAISGGFMRSSLSDERGVPSAEITGYACACAEPTAATTPAVVLDPFGGTGTTALVAKALGRHGISNDMSADYCRLAEWRTNDPGELARAMQVDKPVEQVKGQADLFDLIEGVGA